ncbi:SUKH-4 family immunity protein [Streptomyces sp. NPDC050636]|uniref:SUKH-4 family immunity protein n=1 Tax=Streptomyces sp. NPDC050636 TaxID=3154510 RepID=UPI003440348C
MSVDEWITAAKNPTAKWLESRFGEGSLWRPAEAELPARLEHQETRKFLTTVGFPAVRIDGFLEFIDFDSSDLKDDGPWAEDPDELFGRRTPDDDSPPTKYAFKFGECQQSYLMVDGEWGHVDLYDPNGWDHAAGYAGEAHSSLPVLAGALGLAANFAELLEGPEPLEALAQFREAIEELDPTVESALWEKVTEALEEEYEVAEELGTRS